MTTAAMSETQRSDPSYDAQDRCRGVSMKSRGDLQEHFVAVGSKVEDCLKCGAHQNAITVSGTFGDQTLAHEDDGKGAGPELRRAGERLKLPDNVPQQRKELAGPGAAAKEPGNLHKK